MFMHRALVLLALLWYMWYTAAGCPWPCVCCLHVLTGLPLPAVRFVHPRPPLPMLLLLHQRAGAAAVAAAIQPTAAAAGLMRRELLVLDSCLAAGIPLAGYVGGGYDTDLAVLAERHMVLHRAALRMWTDHGL